MQILTENVTIKYQFYEGDKMMIFEDFLPLDFDKRLAMNNNESDN